VEEVKKEVPAEKKKPDLNIPKENVPQFYYPGGKPISR